MSLSNYATEVGGIADELTELLVGPVGAAAARIVEREDAESLFDMEDEQAERALRLLSQTLSQRTKALAKLGPGDSALLILRARYLGLYSARAIRSADQLSYIPGSSYRAAAERGARAAMGLRKPSVGELFPGSYLFDEADGDDPSPGRG